MVKQLAFLTFFKSSSIRIGVTTVNYMNFDKNGYNGDLYKFLE